ncbi:rhamnosyl/mannosyltransferase [Methylohalomonas lacus]|uniref:Rhamnosyl/mannosyltransferase n=2 Tax=Methylohalomonas lacus TaxID=398773 RepID=A0AAE3HLR3_9GAMM|nr:rhamnosyl/mannosyltransferase [Methylohalomonas lacus]
MSVSALTSFRRHSEWADVLHYHYPWPFADLMHMVGRIKKPAILTYHSDIVRQRVLMPFYRPLMHAFMNRMSEIVATSQNYYATSDVLQHFADMVSVIPIGLDPATYPSPDTQTIDRLREQVGDNFFLFIGVLRYYKGLHILLEAVRHTDLPVVIVGTGPVERELRARASNDSLDNLRFLGQLTDIEKVSLLHLARAVVFPSFLRSEAYGVALVEGAMYGKPLISTEIGTGTSYINIDGETGFVVPPGDSKSLRQVMLKLFNDDTLAGSMGEAARKRFYAYFLADSMGAQYMDVYERVLSQ